MSIFCEINSNGSCRQNTAMIDRLAFRPIFFVAFNAQTFLLQFLLSDRNYRNNSEKIFIDFNFLCPLLLRLSSLHSIDYGVFGSAVLHLSCIVLLIFLVD